MTKIIGVTGGVGCGKSTVLSILEQEYKARICMADTVGHELMKKGTPCYQRIIDTFGTAYLDEDGEICRPKLGALLFADPAKLALQNAIMHPAIKAEIRRRMDQAKADEVPLMILEAALLLEENYDALCDQVWYVYADEKTRRQRLKASRGYSDEKIDDMLKRQISEAEYRSRCQVVIDNSGCLEDSRKQIKEILAL